MDNATAKIIAVTGKEFASAKVTIQFLSVDGDLRETQISTAMAGLMTQHLLNDAQMMIHPLARAFKLIAGCQNIHQLKELTNAVMEPGKGVYFSKNALTEEAA